MLTLFSLKTHTHTEDDKVPSMYDLIKHYCDQKYGIISCCFNMENITEVNLGAKRDYLENFFRKVIGKLNG